MLVVRQTTVEIVRGSVLDQDVDAIVNAANNAMRGGSGVDGAIHRAAGPNMMEELKLVSPRGCRTGEVVVTHGHDLTQRYVLHTPGPLWYGGIRQELEFLPRCYSNCLIAASKLSLTSLAFCSISTGGYRFPVAKASRIATRTVVEWLQENPTSSLRKVIFAMFHEDEYQQFVEALLTFQAPGQGFTL